MYNKKILYTIFLLHTITASLQSMATMTDWDALITAIERGDIEKVQEIVPNCIGADKKTRGDRYLFDIADFHRQIPIRNHIVWQAIIPAIESGNLALVQEIVGKKYIAPDAQTRGGKSLVAIAIHHRQPAIAHYLQSQIVLLSPSPSSSSVATPATASARTSTPARISILTPQTAAAMIAPIAPTDTRPLFFYEKAVPFYEFTNFFQRIDGQPLFITPDGKQWFTSEHYFQAQKLPNTIINTPYGPKNIQEEIRLAPTARDVFTLANARTGTYKQYIDQNWNKRSLDVMRDALYLKFSQNPELKKLLLETGNRYLVENAGAKDDFWGNGADGNGQNWLGKLLMETRSRLR